MNLVPQTRLHTGGGERIHFVSGIIRLTPKKTQRWRHPTRLCQVPWGSCGKAAERLLEQLMGGGSVVGNSYLRHLAQGQPAGHGLHAAPIQGGPWMAGVPTLFPCYF